MAMFDDEPVKKPAVHVVGEPLDRISVAELRQRIEALTAEIARLEEEITRKGATRSAAEDLFRR